MDLSILVLFFALVLSKKVFSKYSTEEFGSRRSLKKRYKTEHDKLANKMSPIWNRPFPHTNPLFCTLGQGLNLMFCLRRTNKYWASYVRVLSMTLTIFLIGSRRFICFNFQHKHNLLVHSKCAVILFCFGLCMYALSLYAAITWPTAVISVNTITILIFCSPVATERDEVLRRAFAFMEGHQGRDRWYVDPVSLSGQNIDLLPDGHRLR